MSIKIKNAETEYEGETDELIRFFDSKKIDVPSILNAPKQYEIHIWMFWVFGILYFIGLLGGYFFHTEDCRFISNVICLLSLVVFSFLIYLRFNKIKLLWVTIVAGLIIYVFSTRGLTNEDMGKWTKQGIDNYLNPDSIYTK